MPACNTCAPAMTGTAQDALVNIMAPVVNGGQPFVAIVGQRPLGVIDFAFEKIISKDEKGRVILNYKIKEGMGSGSKFQFVKTNADCQLEWREQFNDIPKATLDGAVTDDDEVTVTDIKMLRGIGPRAKVFIVDGKSIIQGIVKTVVGNVITLYSNVTLSADACVYRGVYSRSKDCQATIDNKYGLRTEQKYVSNYRNISLSLEFFTCDLSVDRLVNYMGENGETKFIQQYKQAAVEGFVEEFRFAFYTDRNLKGGVDIDGNTIDSDTGADETQGLIPAIERVQDLTDMTLIHDHSVCCDVESSCGGDENMVEGFLDVIRNAHDSGLYPSNRLTVVGNKKFFAALQKLQSAFQSVNGVQVVYPADSGSFTLTQNYPLLNLGGISVEYMADERLDRLPYSMYLVIPKDQIIFAQREYGHLTTDMAVTNEVNYQISTGFPWLKFADRTMFETNGLGDCYKYVSDFQFAIAFGGLDSGAYHIGINFEPCNDSCNVCDETTRTTILAVN